MATGGRGRIRALDGLRGLAAAVVVAHHLLLTVPAFAASYSPEPAETSPIAWIMTWTPLHLAWAGGEAVQVFFVLSGLVLARHMSGASVSRWINYYPRRLLRLYVPVWASVLFAAGLAWAVPRTSDDRMSWWTAAHAFPATLHGLLHEATRLFDTPLNSPLWSLGWEVAFSLLLPAYVLAARLRFPAWMSALVLLGAIELGAVTGNSALTYLPVFGLGVLLHRHRDAIGRVFGPMGARTWSAVVVASLAALLAAWAPGATWPPGPTALSAVGATGVVVTFLHCGAAQQLGSSRLCQILGAYSFSLYLVHEPIIVTAAFLTRDVSGVVVAAVSLPLMAPCTWAFHRWVELPSLAASRRIPLEGPKPLVRGAAPTPDKSAG